MKKGIVGLLALTLLVVAACSDGTITGADELVGPALIVTSVSGADASPAGDQVVVVGTKNRVYFDLKMIAVSEPVKVTSLKFTAVGNVGITTIQNIRIREGSPDGAIVVSAAQFDSRDNTSITWSATDNILSAPITKDGTTLYLQADIMPGGAARLGDDFRFLIADTADIKIKGATSGTAGTVIGTPSAIGVTYVVPQSVTIEAVSPKTAMTVGMEPGQTIGVFKVTNKGNAPIYIGKSIRFANSGSSISPALSLYISAMGGNSNDTSASRVQMSGGAGGGSSGGMSSSAVYFDMSSLQKESSISESVRKIIGGSWRYLTVKTNGVSKNNGTFKLSVYQLGDIVYEAYESELGYTADPSDGDLSDNVKNLYVEGTPSLATVTAKE